MTNIAAVSGVGAEIQTVTSQEMRQNSAAGSGQPITVKNLGAQAIELIRSSVIPLDPNVGENLNLIA